MKPLLLHRDRDADWDTEPAAAASLIQDLGLGRLFDAMAAGDDHLRDVARRVLLLSVCDPTEITYRQQVLRDFTAHPGVARRLYDLAVEAVTGEKKIFHLSLLLDRSPSAQLIRSVEVMRFLTGLLRRLHDTAAECSGDVDSPGLTELFATLARELDDDFLATVEDHLNRLSFPRGVLVSAELGFGCKPTGFVLRRPNGPDRSWLSRLLTPEPALTLRLAERDEAGAQALSELRDRGLDLVADTLAHAVDDVLGFFTTLRNEVGCYLTCLNLQQRLADLGEPVCLPEPAPPDARAFSARGLYDPVLSLRTGRRAVGNDIDADDTPLVVVTGANSGGKSTFLRSVGIAQLLMQAGMTVPAELLRASPADGVFTHYRREEDAAMDRGKLDEELARMRDITDHVRPGSLVLCNESFASTNEREGSQIARGVLAALTDAGVRVVIVTHLHDLARDLHDQHPPGVLFLRAERCPDGARTYRLVPREPLPTSFAQDLYEQIFGRPVQAAGSDAGGVRHDSPSPSVA